MKITKKVILSLFILTFIWACTDDTDQFLDDMDGQAGIAVTDATILSFEPLVDPITIDGESKGGNRTCEEAGAEFPVGPVTFEYSTGKVDYELKDEYGDSYPNSDFETSFEGYTIKVIDGTYVSWSFTPPEGYCLVNMAGIVKGGKDANVYYYEGEIYGDEGLSAPDNNSGMPAELSNLTFCYNLEECCTEWIVYGSNQGVGNGIDGPDAIYAYDLNAQTQTLVYDPTPVDGSPNYPNANAYDPVNQRIYCGTDDGRIFYYDIDDDIWIELTTNENFGTMACGAWYDGKFYYVQNGTDNLYEVEIVSNVATRKFIGDVPNNNGYGDIVFDPANPGVFIGSAGSTPVWYVYDLNTNTSQVLTANVTDNHKQLAYGSNGILYAVEAVSGQFYTVVYDTDAGNVTLTADWDSPYRFTDLASGPQCQK